MNSDTFFLIKVVFGIIAAIFTLSAAIFTFLDTAQNEKTENTQAWFCTKWEAINDSRWMRLPERVTEWLLSRRDFLTNSVDRITGPEWLGRSLYSGILVLIFITCLLHFGLTIALFALLFSFPLFVFPLTGKFLTQLSNNSLLHLYDLLSSIIVMPVTIFLSLRIILNLDIYLASLLVILLIPLIWLAIYTLFFPFAVDLMTGNLKKTAPQWNDFLNLFGVGVAGGFTITLVALAVGHLVEPGSFVPKTLQMLLSNVIFDGLTVAVTFLILSRALSKDGFFNLPLIILLDLFVAATFALCSLYLGLVYTDHAVSVTEAGYILIGRSRDNTHFEFSPYFWVMHTTFIPTLLYLLIILLCWVGKALLIPVRGFFGLGQENKNPLKLTAGLCGIFAAIFTILFFVTGSIQERAKEIQTKPAQPVIIENHN